MSSPKRTKDLMCTNVTEVFQQTIKAQTRALARAVKDNSKTLEAVRDSMRADCALLGINDLDNDLPPVVHVAGTKGKGSTCAFLEAILREGKLRTGLFTSPHLVDIRERIRINGQLIPQAIFDEHVMETYRTLGIGGKLDYTNAVDTPLACAITRLDLDHTELLGKTIELIAAQKAGIAKKNVPLFTPTTQIEAGLRVIEKECQLVGAKLEVVEPLSESSSSIGIAGGPHQLENAALSVRMAKEVFSNLKMDEMTTKEVFEAGLSKCRLPGRCQIEKNIEDDQTFYLDGAHTPLSVECASKWFQSVASQSDGKKALIFHCSPDRDASSMLKIIAHEIPDIFVTYFIAPTTGVNSGSNTYHSDLLNTWKNLEHESPVTTSNSFVMDTPQNLKNSLKEFKEVKHILVIGSFYLVGDALRYWVNDWSIEKAFV